MSDKMPRKKTEGTFMGVCAMISDKLDLDVFFVRVITLIILLSSGGMGIIIYFLLGMFAVGE